MSPGEAAEFASNRFVKRGYTREERLRDAATVRSPTAVLHVSGSGRYIFTRIPLESRMASGCLLLLLGYELPLIRHVNRLYPFVDTAVWLLTTRLDFLQGKHSPLVLINVFIPNR